NAREYRAAKRVRIKNTFPSR
ncbi:4Fe-4S dicluster domain protein, partial [Vibrio cholerae HC-69A1]